MDLLRKLPIGQFVDGERSWLRLLDPRLKILWVTFFLVSPILSSALWRIGLVVLLCIISFSSLLPSRVWLRSFIYLLVFSSIVGLFSVFLPTSEASPVLMIRNPDELGFTISHDSPWELLNTGTIKILNMSIGSFTIDRRSAELAIKSSTLLFTVVHSVNLMLLTSPPEDLVWALRWFLNPLALFGVNIDRFSFQLLLSLRFIPLVQEEFQNLIRSISLRVINFRNLGFKLSLGLVISIGERLLLNILLRSNQGADALLARGGYIISPSSLRPKSLITKMSCPNFFALSAFFAIFLVRIKIGSY